MEPSPTERRSGADWLRHYLPDLFYGANDGIITTFAVVSGVTGAALSPAIAFILGFANLFADGFSMGASSFLSIRSRESVLAAEGKPPEEEFPVRHSVATFLAFITAGSVPLTAFALAPGEARFAVAAGVTLATLFTAGALRATVTPVGWIKSGLEMLAVGVVASAVAYSIGGVVDSIVLG